MIYLVVHTVFCILLSISKHFFQQILTIFLNFADVRIYLQPCGTMHHPHGRAPRRASASSDNLQPPPPRPLLTKPPPPCADVLNGWPLTHFCKFLPLLPLDINFVTITCSVTIPKPPPLGDYVICKRSLS